MNPRSAATIHRARPDRVEFYLIVTFSAQVLRCTTLVYIIHLSHTLSLSHSRPFEPGTSVYGSTPRLSFSLAYGDHMVLQRAPLRAQLWGRCDGCDDGETVSISAEIEGGSATTVATGTAVGASCIH